MRLGEAGNENRHNWQVVKTFIRKEEEEEDESVTLSS